MLNRSLTLPDNVMELEDNRFFEFIEQVAGEKLAFLLACQDINNATCLLACENPFEILSLDSNDLLDLKKKTCIKLNDNSFVVLPGIKGKLNILRKALSMKSNQLKKNLTQERPFMIDQSTRTSFASTAANSATDSSDTSRHYPSLANVSLQTEEQVKRHVAASIDDWCKKRNENKHQQTLQFKEMADYDIIVDIDGDRVLIKCGCCATSTLGRKDNSYLLSNYIRHLTNRNPCRMVQEKLNRTHTVSFASAVSTFNSSPASDDSAAEGTFDSVAEGASDSASPIGKSLSKRKRNQVPNSLSVYKKKTKT